MAILKEQQITKRRRIRYTIIICLCLIPALTYLETLVFQLGEVPFPVSGNVLVFALININILLLLLMAFLALRRLVEHIFEHRRNLLGTRLRSKLIISFVSLSLIPTALLFFIALQFVSTSMDYWFNSNVEQSLHDSLEIAKTIYQQSRRQITRHGINIAARLSSPDFQNVAFRDMDVFFNNSLAANNLEGLELISDQRKSLIQVLGEELADKQMPDIPAEQLRLALAGEPNQIVIQDVPEGELVRSITQVIINSEVGAAPYALVATLLIPRSQLKRMEVISNGVEGYRQLVLLKNPIKTSLLVMLLIITLLIIFSAIWFGFYVAHGLTVPIVKMTKAIGRVADGELDFVLEKESDDEMGLLIDSFNKMTRDLLSGKQQLEEANLALQKSYLEIDERRQYTEIILQNVAAGVISVDHKDMVTTINRFAEELLKINRADYLNRNFRDILLPDHIAVLNGFLEELHSSGKNSIQRPLQLSVRQEIFSLLVNLTKIEDDLKKPLGFVLVFDNLTQLEKAQRMAAWREVARRIAHEVKNPLTPIQLSAQRLRKRYLADLKDQGEVFDLCTRTIINQVEELKRLVSEFSNFARMPAVQKSLHSLPEMVKEILSLYQEAHGFIDFRSTFSLDIEPFYFDLKQMKRVLINLLDNAVAVLKDDGIVEVRLSLDIDRNVVLMEVRDNGPGIREKDKLHLFEPYFSTKKTGTGLGLTIASTVVADHGGYVRIKDNIPNGAIFIIELPFST